MRSGSVMSEVSQTVGILGGGQLARMLALAAAPLGVRCLAVDQAPDACAGQIAELVQAEWHDERTRVFPNPRALTVAQERLTEKNLFRACGLDTPAFVPVDTRPGLDEALGRIGAPAILKTRRFGYDGKGQFRIKSPADADAAWRALGAHTGRAGLILESFVPFVAEVSVVAVRARDGDFRTWPLTRNWHVDGILSASLAPAPADDAIAGAAFAHARAIAEELDYVGVFALELFVSADAIHGQELRGQRLLGNEMAPRVHNSGHWTLDG